MVLLGQLVLEALALAKEESLERLVVAFGVKASKGCCLE